MTSASSIFDVCPEGLYYLQDSSYFGGILNVLNGFSGLFGRKTLDEPIGSDIY